MWLGRENEEYVARTRNCCGWPSSPRLCRLYITQSRNLTVHTKPDIKRWTKPMPETNDLNSIYLNEWIFRIYSIQVISGVWIHNRIFTMRFKFLDYSSPKKKEKKSLDLEYPLALIHMAWIMNRDHLIQIIRCSRKPPLKQINGTESLKVGFYGARLAI